MGQLYKCVVQHCASYTSTAAQQGNTVQGNKKRQFDGKKTVNVADVALFMTAQTQVSSLKWVFIAGARLVSLMHPHLSHAVRTHRSLVMKRGS